MNSKWIWYELEWLGNDGFWVSHKSSGSLKQLKIKLKKQKELDDKNIILPREWRIKKTITTYRKVK